MSDAPVRPTQDGQDSGDLPRLPVERNGAQLDLQPVGHPRRRRRAATVRAIFGRVPTAAWICALIALLNATVWSVITPPFQGRDEVDHFAYIEQLAETGTLPKNGSEEGTYSPEETLVLQALDYYGVRFTAHSPSLSSIAQQQTLNKAVHAGASLEGTGEAGVATTEPPLYYALQTIPYALGRGNILTQLQLMRLVGALLAAITTLLVFFFIRETLPGVPWAATVGTLCIAMQPLFGFMSGSVNPDTLMFTLSAGVFLCLARAFRRGMNRRLAIMLGLLVFAGLLTKLNFIGLAIGVFAGLLLLTMREMRLRGRDALVPLAIAAGIGVAPVILYVLRNVLSSHPAFGVVSGLLHTITARSFPNELSYIWELYLPRLPGMTHYFTGIVTFKDIWFDRSVGLYGWMDTMFPGWVDNVALIPAGLIALLCGREIYRQHAALRSRLLEFATYALVSLGLLGMLGAASYSSDAIAHKYAFGEPRYLLPLLPLIGTVVALAARGGGRRWAPVIGAALVVLFLGHDVLSQLQVIARYYG